MSASLGLEEGPPVSSSSVSGSSQMVGTGAYRDVGWHSKALQFQIRHGLDNWRRHPKKVPSSAGVLVSADRSLQGRSQFAGQAAPAALGVSAGDFVIVQAVHQDAPKADGNWWMGQVLGCDGGFRDPMVNTMLQVSDVDDGFIHWVNGDEVKHIVRSLDGLQLGSHECYQWSKGY